MAKKGTKDKGYQAQPSYRPIFLDALFRFAVIYAYLYHGWSPITFWLLQLVVIPATILLFAVFEIEKATSQIVQVLHLKKGTVLVADLKALDTFLLFAISFFWATLFFASLTFDTWIRLILVVPVFVLFALFHFMWLMVPRRVSQKTAEEPLEEGEQESTAKYEAPTAKNQAEVIMQQDIEIKFLSSRVDAYTLESTLFGGLAFAGFLTTIFARPTNIANLQSLWSLIASLIQGARDSASPVFTQVNYFTQANVISTIALLSLLCSLFFVTALITRLRFNFFLTHVLKAFTLAKTYSSRQEEMRLLSHQGSTKAKRVAIQIAELEQKIFDKVQVSTHALDKLKPMASYVAFFRTLGLWAFIASLVTAASLVSLALAAFFALFILGAMTLGTIDLNDRVKSLFEKFRPSGER